MSILPAIQADGHQAACFDIIKNLPNELRSLVFERLYTYELLSSKLVCKNWYNYTSSDAILKRRVGDKWISTYIYSLAATMPAVRVFVELAKMEAPNKARSIKWLNKAKKLLEKYGCYVRVHKSPSSFIKLVNAVLKVFYVEAKIDRDSAAATLKKLEELTGSYVMYDFGSHIGLIKDKWEIESSKEPSLEALEADKKIAIENTYPYFHKTFLTIIKIEVAIDPILAVNTIRNYKSSQNLARAFNTKAKAVLKIIKRLPIDRLETIRELFQEIQTSSPDIREIVKVMQKKDPDAVPNTTERIMEGISAIVIDERAVEGYSFDNLTKKTLLADYTILAQAERLIEFAKVIENNTSLLEEAKEKLASLKSDTYRNSTNFLRKNTSRKNRGLQAIAALEAEKDLEKALETVKTISFEDFVSCDEQEHYPKEKILFKLAQQEQDCKKALALLEEAEKPLTRIPTLIEKAKAEMKIQPQKALSTLSLARKAEAKSPKDMLQLLKFYRSEMYGDPKFLFAIDEEK